MSKCCLATSERWSSISGASAVISRTCGRLSSSTRSGLISARWRVGLVEVETEQELLQQLPVLRPAGVVAERGDLQPEAVEPQRPEAGVGDGDHLGVQRGVVDADGLDADLLQLPVAAGLRALVAEERAGVAELDRQRAAVQAVLDDRPHDARRCPPGAASPTGRRGRRRCTSPWRPRRWTRRPRGRTARCPRRSAARRRRSRPAGRRPADRRGPRRTRPTRAAGSRGHPWAPGKSAHSVRPSRNGLVRRSTPMVVVRPCPGSTTVSSSSTSSFVDDRAQQVAAAAAGQVGAARPTA